MSQSLILDQAASKCSDMIKSLMFYATNNAFRKCCQIQTLTYHLWYIPLLSSPPHASAGLPTNSTSLWNCFAAPTISCSSAHSVHLQSVQFTASLHWKHSTWPPVLVSLVHRRCFASTREHCRSTCHLPVPSQSVLKIKLKMWNILRLCL